MPCSAEGSYRVIALQTSDSPRLLRLRVAFKLSIAIVVVTAMGVVLGFLGGGNTGPPTGTARYSVSDVEPGEARRIVWNGRPVIVLRHDSPDGDWFVAIASGTAMGCPVSWESTQQTFLEACSGTRYDADGRPLDAAGLAPLEIPPHHFDTAGRLVLGRD